MQEGESRMRHQAELDFLAGALRRMRLRLVLVSPGDSLEEVDMGLRGLFGLAEEYQAFEQILLRMLKQRTIYRLMDAFGCCYFFFALPDDRRTVVIGPYLTADLTSEAVLETAERLGLPLVFAGQLTDYYAALPIFEDTSMLMALVSAMGDTLWGGMDAFETIDLNRDSTIPLVEPMAVAAFEQNQLALQMKNIQLRYDYENDMMEAVSRGLLQRVERITASLSRLNFEKRMADPLRNTKNYCIICNTLLRKAAERGGVHPLHIDRISSQYAVQIENKATVDGCVELIGEMFRAYCRLVRSHAISHYSASVQKLLIYLEENLSGDLSLKKLAEVLNLSPVYLSELFHRETNQTLTQHITRLRMEHAMHLLKTTQLQVQHVAQLCGVPDANYFSKLFRKQYGLTPRQFRQTLLPTVSKKDRDAPANPSCTVQKAEYNTLE